MNYNTLKISLLSLLFTAPLSIIAQNKLPTEVKTTVSEVTVFIKGAQVLRKTTIAFPTGKSTFRFSGLSPYIDPKSVQLKIDGEVMTVSVNHQLNYNDTIKRTDEMERLAQQIRGLDDKIDIDQTNMSILKEELAFLRDNSKIGGSYNGLNLATLKATDEYYTARVTSIQTKIREMKKEINTLQDKKNIAERNLAQIGSLKTEPTGEIHFSVEAPYAVRALVELIYYVSNASWFPSYDIRAKSISEPLEIVYKANVTQNTMEEWKNVRLTISSKNPFAGAVAPKLIPYKLDYYTPPPRYNTDIQSSQVQGRVTDGSGNPLSGVSITVKGSTIGTITEANGAFSLPIPANRGELLFSYVGYVSVTMPISSRFMNITMHEDVQNLDEAVVIGYSPQKRSSVVSSVSSVSAENRQAKSKAIELPTVKVENATSVEFLVKIPYSIPSANKNTVVEVEHYEAPADYHYFCAPKADRDAFLLADIADWERFNLLEGEANIFFENTFVGKTILDVRYLSDTLHLSLGRDRNVTVSREKVKDYTSQKFLGTKVETLRGWRITVRNNKQQPITMTLCDQIPVSTMSEIEVTPENLSDGALNKETGELTWRFTLLPSQRKELELKYKVKYPKGKTLMVE